MAGVAFCTAVSCTKDQVYDRHISAQKKAERESEEPAGPRHGHAKESNASRLIDTGAILAVVLADDRWQSACLDALQSVRIRLLTSQTFLTGLFHLMENNLDYIRSGAVSVRPVADSDLPTLGSLVVQYDDCAMDSPMLLWFTCLSRIVGLDLDHRPRRF